MNKTKTALVSAAVAGILLGSTITLTSCKSSDQGSAAAAMDKHSCKGMNGCKGQGGCKTAANECAGKNACKSKGGCATAKHA